MVGGFRLELLAGGDSSEDMIPVNRDGEPEKASPRYAACFSVIDMEGGCTKLGVSKLLSAFHIPLVPGLSAGWWSRSCACTVCRVYQMAAEWSVAKSHYLPFRRHHHSQLLSTTPLVC